jgi:poly-gamma-glutamate synthesis protein (capsule biosynthesis protein)
MLGVANNHTFNYGSIGVLETIDFVEAAGMKIAGGGYLQRAREPVFHYTANATVALLSATSSFTDFQKASNSRPDVHGRAGCNPLAVTTASMVSRATADKLLRLAEQDGLSEFSERDGMLNFLGQQFVIGDQNARIMTANEDDVNAILEQIRRAKVAADVVVFSMHAHRQGEWLTDFAHQAIDAGVDAFLVSGPHYINPIEIYRGRPIFYSLGNFTFQSETVARLPAEYMERQGFDETRTAQEFQAATRDRWNVNRVNWEGLVATVHLRDGEVETVRLIPTNLGVGRPGTEGVRLPFGVRGRPVLADDELGEYLIGKVTELSRPFGTEIEYVSSENIGVVRIR